MASWLEAARAWLAPKQPEMLALLERMVNVESGSLDKEGVDRFGELMAGELERRGFRVETEFQPSSGNHVRGTLEGSGPSQVLVLGHLDTVWPRGTLATWPFSISNGRAHGPGVGDMRAGLVVALYAIEALRAVGGPLPGRLVFMLTGDEEVGSPTARAAVEAEGQRSRAVLVTEHGRPGGALVTARGGVGMCRLDFKGRTAYTATFDAERASAIEALAQATLRLHALSRVQERVSVSVGLIGGGSARQVIAEHAWAMVDLRAPTREAVEALDRAVREALAEAPPGTSVEYNLRWGRPPAPRTPATQALLDLAREVGAELGQELPEVSVGGGSDGSFCAALGIPVLDGLGPISRNICSREEYVELDSVLPRAELLAGLLGRLGEGR